MFRTKHLEGRSVYETDEVVCFNVFLNSFLSNHLDIYLPQVLLSFDTYEFVYNPIDFTIISTEERVSAEDAKEELQKGINDYRKTRKKLGIKK